jgi:hypothetical protein
MNWCEVFLLAVGALALIGSGFAWLWRLDGK